MGIQRTWADFWREGLISGLCVSCLGLVLWQTHDHELPVGENGWSRASYDYSYLFRPDVPIDDIIIVAMDESSFRALELGMQDLWPRSLHAELLDKLTADKARLAVFDVWFNDPGNEAENRQLAEAMRANGRVVLAAVLAQMNTLGIAGETTMLPRSEFLTNAAGWGVSEVYQDADGVCRQIYTGTETDPSLSWAAAQLLQPDLDAEPLARRQKRWLDYYGPARHLRFISYAEALKRPPGFFRDKVVIIGAQNQTLRVYEENDEFATPYTRWYQTFASGPEIVATSLWNLAQRDWHKRMPAWLEAGFILIMGLVLGFGLSRWPPLSALGLAILAAFLLCAISNYVMWKAHLWYSWLIILGAQVPIAWLGALVIHKKRVNYESRFLRQTLDETINEIKRPSALTPWTAGQDEALHIPDHELLRRVGKGAYGEVWLARNTIGMFHAVKIVRRDAFADDAPYDREFRGIQNYMPVSRSHPGLVNILHVGRNDQAGYFFYIMEAADDEVTGTTIVPDTYRPRSLGSVLGNGRILAVDNCVTLMVALAGALEALHAKKLVHRDIKPSNIIYLNGVPMFADIGLVTESVSRQNEVTMVGTRGYMPPEGPGMPSADVYGLGKVLYQSATGMSPEMFPELPTDFMDRPDFAKFKPLNVIIGRACDSEVSRRYQTAGEMHEALLRLQFQWRGSEQPNH